MTLEVHTENGIEEADDPSRESRWKERAAWLLMIGVLLGIVLTLVWIGSVDASASGGCGG